MRDQIEAVFDRIRWLTARQATPGICVQIQVEDDHFALSAGLHTVRRDAPMTTETGFPMGCITKSLMALACAELHRAGRLDLHAPVADYLPELCDAAGRPEVRLVHLLSHSAGYVEPQISLPFQELNWDRFVCFFHDRKQAFRPGAVWSYTQTGHAIVARVLEKVVGAPALEHLKRHILEDLGIGPSDIGSRAANLRACASFHAFSAKTSRYEPIAVPPDSGFFRESISDVPLSIQELSTLGRALNERTLTLVDPETIDLACEPQIEVGPQAASADAELMPQAYGLGVGRYGKFWGLTGSYLGSTCAIRSCPNKSVVVAIAMNAWTPGIRDRLLSRLMSALGGYERPAEHVALACPPEDWIGEYEGLSLESGVMTITRRDDGVECAIRQQRGEKRVVLARRPDGRYGVRASRPVSLGFHREPGSGAAYVRVGASAFRKAAAG